jgi:hypothetical protein
MVQFGVQKKIPVSEGQPLGEIGYLGLTYSLLVGYHIALLPPNFFYGRRTFRLMNSTKEFRKIDQGTLFGAHRCPK